MTLSCEADHEMYMLGGSIELEVSGEHFVLKVADTAQFRVIEPHCLKNPGDVNAVCLWVFTPVILHL